MFAVELINKTIDIPFWQLAIIFVLYIAICFLIWHLIIKKVLRKLEAFRYNFDDAPITGPFVLSAALLFVFMIMCIAVTVIQTFLSGQTELILGSVLFVICVIIAIAFYVVLWKASKRK